MEQEKEKFRRAVYLPVVFVFIIWVIEIVETNLGLSFVRLGVYPQQTKGLAGIITAPFIHGDYLHLLSNTFSLLMLAVGVGYFYPNSSRKVYVVIWLVTGFMVWLWARPSYHIGASGLIYGMVAFLFFSGAIRKDLRASVLALIVVFFYGSLIWGVLPIKDGVSWESHLFGGISGIIAAILFRKQDPYERKYSWEDEEDDDDDDTPPNKLEINWDNVQR